ncbi:MAG: SgcJ/EcaC family oxidoreductase [Paracoccaceae bacterium]
MDQTAILSTIETMTRAFAAGDMESILSTYETDATVVSQPGVPVSGEDGLRAMFGQFIAQGVAFTYGAHDVVVSGDIALHLMKWTAPTPDGEVSALSVAVLRRQADGGWKMVIDQPFGDAVMRAAPAQ